MTKKMIHPPCRQESDAPEQEYVRARRECPYCGLLFYEKLSDCTGTIQIKCSRCGKRVDMNLAFRTC